MERSYWEVMIQQPWVEELVISLADSTGCAVCSGVIWNPSVRSWSTCCESVPAIHSPSSFYAVFSPGCLLACLTDGITKEGCWKVESGSISYPVDFYGKHSCTVHRRPQAIFPGWSQTGSSEIADRWGGILLDMTLRVKLPNGPLGRGSLLAKWGTYRSFTWLCISWKS